MKHTHHIRIQLTIHRPSPQLCDRVVARMVLAQRRHDRKMKYLFLGLAVVSSVSAVVALIAMVRAFSASNVGSYLSLVLSDAGMLGQYWREIMLSVAESFPVMSVVFAGVLGGVALYSVRRLYKRTYPVHRSAAFAS